MKNYLKLLSLILLILNVFISKAQQNDTLDIQRNDKGVVNFARFRPNSVRKILNDTLFLKSILQAKNEDGFRSISESTDELSIVHKKFQQYYRGLKVENAEYLTHSKNGNIETINGDFVRINISSVTPSISEQQALKKAFDFVNAKKYKWEDKAYENFIKQRTNNPDATFYPKGELLIAKDYLKGGNNFRLSWKFTISSLIPDNEQWIYIDAVSGEIIGNTQLILDANNSGTAQTLYSQTIGITCDSYPGGFRLSEIRNTTPGNSANIHTWNCLTGSNYTNAVEFSNNNTNWVTGNWPAIGQDQAALDAHWGEEKILDYWSTVQTRNGLNSQGMDIIGYVHFFDATRPDIWPNNAQWDPTSHVMRYGDGDGVTFNPLTALDIVAHEMGHGINQFTANLHSATNNQECDALNEGFSDIWGACIEHWAAPTKQTWLIAEEIFKTPTYNCIRNLQNPKSTTASEGMHPDTYHGKYWDNNGEPHNNSTVLSHWFYLLSQGGSGTNDIPNSYSVYGIGINTAQLIVYNTESSYLTSSSDYTATRNATISAATSKYGANSLEVMQVQNAWYAVGLGSAPIQMSLSGSTLVCSSGANFTVNNPPTGATITWTFSSNLQAYYGGNNWIALKAIGNGAGWVQPTIKGASGSAQLPQYPVWVGALNPPVISGPVVPKCGYDLLYQVDANTKKYSQSYYWESDIFSISVRNLYNCTARVYYSQPGYISCTVNTCGIAVKGTKYIQDVIPCNNVSLALSPNPASNNVQVAIVNGQNNISDSVSTNTVTNISSLAITDNITNYNVSIYDSYGIKLYTTKRTGSLFTLAINNFINGVYIIEVNDGINSYHKQLIIKH